MYIFTVLLYRFSFPISQSPGKAADFHQCCFKVIRIFRTFILLQLPTKHLTGVAVTGTAETLWRTTLQSRLTELVLVRVGDPFHAPDL